MRKRAIKLVHDQAELRSEVVRSGMVADLLSDVSDGGRERSVELYLPKPQLKFLIACYHVNCVESFDRVVRVVLEVDLADSRQGVKVLPQDDVEKQLAEFTAPA